jgi:hypothetical protein
MASWNAVVYPPPSWPTPTQMSLGPHQLTLVTPTKVPQFKMTGYYMTGSVYESWTSYRYPNLTPPSGHSLTNITYVQLQG